MPQLAMPPRWQWRRDRLSAEARGLLRDCVMLIPFWDATPYDVVRKQFPTTLTMSGRKNTIEGDGLALDATASDVLAYPGLRDFEQPTTEITVLMRFVAQNEDNGGNISWYLGQAEGTTRGTFSMHQNGNGAEFLGFHAEIGGGGQASSNFVTLTQGQLYQAYGRWVSGDDYQLRCYDERGLQVLEALGGTNRSGTLTYNGDDFRIGANNDASPQHHSADLLYVAVWKRRLTDAEADQLAADPYLIFRDKSALEVAAPSGDQVVPIQPATLTLNAPAVTPVGTGTATVPVEPASLSVAAPAVTPTGSGTATIALSPASVAVNAVALTPVVSGGPQNVALSPASISLAAVAVSPVGSGTATIPLSPSSLSVAAVAVNPALSGGPQNVALAAAVLNLVGPAVTPVGSGTATVALAVAQLTVAAPALSPAVGGAFVALAAASLSVLAPALSPAPTGTATVALEPASMSLAAPATTPVGSGSAVVPLNPATLSLIAVAVSAALGLGTPVNGPTDVTVDASANIITVDGSENIVEVDG